MYIFLIFNTLNSDLFLIVGHPATVVGKFRRGCLLKSSMRSRNMARNCRERLSTSSLQGHTPCVFHCNPSRATSRPTAQFKIIIEVTVVIHFQLRLCLGQCPMRDGWVHWIAYYECPGPRYAMCSYVVDLGNCRIQPHTSKLRAQRIPRLW